MRPLLLLLPALACAHGINGHVHVTGWAIESLPPGDLKDFFSDPELFDAALIGAAFPDSGYAIDDGYGEIAHWEPFTESHVADLTERFGPDFEGLDARKQMAFLMGVASHGLQDELFDSIFLHQVAAHDGGGQDEADPGTDAFLHTDGHLRFRPPQWAPYEDLVRLYAEAHGHEVSAQTMSTGLTRVKLIVIDGVDALYPRLDEMYRPLIPWTAAHYMNIEIPGSITSEIAPTARYLEALWARLHGDWPVSAAQTHPYPAPERRLLGLEGVDAWVTVVFGAGARLGSLNAERVHLDGPDGPVAFELRHTRWSGRPEDWTRLVQLRPSEALAPDTEYRVRLSPGIEFVDGRSSEAEWSYAFRTGCEAGDERAECTPAPGGIPDLSGPPVSVMDAGTPEDAGVDAGPPEDAGADAAPPPVSALVDAGPPPSLVDAWVGAEPPPSTTSETCSQTPGRGSAPLFLLGLVLAGLRRSALP